MMNGLRKRAGMPGGFMGLVLLAAALSCLSSIAQAPAGGQAGLNAVLLRLFSDFPGFTAKADVSFREKSASETVTMRIGFAMRDGNARLELDLTEVKSKQLGREEVATLKRARLDKMTTILRTDRKTAIIVYPEAESYVELPLAKDEAADLSRLFRFEKKLLAKEALDGHPCEKTRVLFLGGTGEKHEMVVWYATDLRSFPIKVQMNQEGATVVLHYREVSLTKPEEAGFEVPARYTKYADPERLRQAAALNMLQHGK